jgi:hypothetical protein
LRFIAESILKQEIVMPVVISLALSPLFGINCLNRELIWIAGNAFRLLTLSPGLAYVFDHMTDGNKLKEISAKRLDLQSSIKAIDRTSPESQAALFSIHFQDSVYEGIEKYTQTEYKTKAVAATGLLVSAFALAWISMGKSVSEERIDSPYAKIVMFGLINNH